MAVAFSSTLSSGAFTSRSTAPRRSLHARSAPQVLPSSPSSSTQRMWTGSRSNQNPLLQPRHLQLQQQRGNTVCQGLFGLGLPEIAVIAGVAALIFGPSKLPELGKGLGKTVKSFQTAAKEFKTELEQAASEGDDAAAAAAGKGAAGEQKEAAAGSKKE